MLSFVSFFQQWSCFLCRHKPQCNLSLWQFHQDWDVKDHNDTKELEYHSLLSILVKATLSWLQFFCGFMEALAYQTLANHAQALVVLSLENQVCCTYLVSFLLQLHIYRLFVFWIHCPWIRGCIYIQGSIKDTKIRFFLIFVMVSICTYKI